MNPVAGTRRTLTLADGMILIAASGVGLAVYQRVQDGILGGRSDLSMLMVAPPGGWTTGKVLIRAVQVIAPVLPFMASWTLTVPILRFRSPRPSPRRCLRQPGIVACLGAIAGFVWAAAGLAGTLAIDRGVSNALGPRPELWLFHIIVEELFPYVGLATGSALGARWLARPWTRPADWIDRFGRILGGFWIAAGLVWACRRYLSIVAF